MIKCRTTDQSYIYMVKYNSLIGLVTTHYNSLGSRFQAFPGMSPDHTNIAITIISLQWS